MSPRRVTLVADQALGYHKTGGLGTATTYLALALGRMGHEVEILYLGELTGEPVAAEWTRLYDDAGVRVRPLPPYETPVEPAYFGRMRAVELALRERPPDVAIVQDLGAPGYVAVRLRTLGLAFEDTLFVLYCHGSRQWITNMSRKVRVLPGALAVGRLEQACVELADVVVSPSAYMVGWMRGQGWKLPEDTLVIPLVTRSAATGETPPVADANGGVDRVTFFGRFEERKGIRPFVEGVNALPPDLLRQVELEFLGRSTSEFTPETIDGLISEQARSALRQVTYQTDLDQHEALARLSRPGTLAVVPSTEDNSPNVVYECLERRIPFLASRLGGTGELVAADDRERVLFTPTPEGIAMTLRRALTESVPPARPAFDGDGAVHAWAGVVGRDTAFPRAAVSPDEGDWEVLEPELRDVLWRAQAATGADVVTCGVRVEGTEHLFSGNPGGLGLLADDYGEPALVRRGLLDASDAASAGWPLLARLSAGGAHIASIPLPLVAASSAPGTLERSPAEALLVIEELERTMPRAFASLARLAGGLADAAQARRPSSPGGRARRVARRLLRRRR